MTLHRSVRAEGADIRKTLQLCKQVERTLSLVLTGECSDDVLRDLLVTCLRWTGKPVGRLSCFWSNRSKPSCVPAQR